MTSVGGSSDEESTCSSSARSSSGGLGRFSSTGTLALMGNLALIGSRAPMGGSLQGDLLREAVRVAAAAPASWEGPALGALLGPGLGCLPLP